jgi:hypothetical protein
MIEFAWECRHGVTCGFLSSRTDRLRYRLADNEGDKRMVWDVPGNSGYGDLLEEATE